MECTLCPVSCGADRPDFKGACSADGLKIAKYYLHPFEEPPVSFSKGSGCIFFCGCSLKCVFCQNYELSRNTRGKQITVEDLAAIFKELEQSGADNINLVNPTHYVREIAAAFSIYRPSIPVVYNTHGYEKLETLALADKFTDIWLPDLKFMSREGAARYCARENYAEFALPAIEYMAQKPLKFDENGKMLSGCIVRHLVLPLNAGEAVKAVNFVATLPKDTYFSLMSQYTPYGDIKNIPELQRRITKREYLRVLGAVEAADLKNVFIQDYESADAAFIPEWDY
ncbi:MAG: radical SAM protein [Clostridia bacterium]|nr:radical SAM protein [Clostridia bacterium]